MKHSGWKLGTWAGIGVYVHWTFLLLVAYVLLSGGGLLNLALVMAVFACVVLHEYGHALMARRYGIGTKHITLYPIGGVAQLERLPREPRQEIAVALAGPAVNVVIAFGLAVVLLVQGLLGITFGSGIITTVMVINVILAAFNLLPAFPMDGGRVLRAALVKRKGYLGATTIAARIGRWVAIVFAVIAIVSWTPSLLLLAGFVYLMAGLELRQVAWQHQMGQGGMFVPPGPPPASGPWDRRDYQEIEVEVLPPRPSPRDPFAGFSR